MNVLFLTLIDMTDLSSGGIYQDLISELIKKGNSVYSVFPTERRRKEKTALIEKNGHFALKVKTLNIQKTSLFEKALSTLTIEKKFIKAIKKHFKGVKFDLILYSTPPITFAGTVKYFKKRDGAKTYLLLKDIFPQNAVDMGLISKKGPVYGFFRKKEKSLYKISDFIGCMSKANVDYLLKENPEIPADKVEVCPNSLKGVNGSITDKEKVKIREKYNLPIDKKIFICGGNLGIPQDSRFMIDCFKSQKDNSEVFFCVVGDGTEYNKFEDFVKKEKPENFKLIRFLPFAEYGKLAQSCDAGLLFLDHRFTIPNYPSRLLTYLVAGTPVLALVDKNTDVGKDIEKYGAGVCEESSDVKNFENGIKRMLLSDLGLMGKNAIEFFNKEFTAKQGAEIILSRLK